MRDTIYRDDAIRVASGYCHPANVAKELAKLPSAEPERKRKTGRWIAHDLSIKDVPTECCSECCEWSYGWHEKYCPKCGSPMEVEQRDYERASDMRDYCERYEPTYNSEDGSM